MFRRHIAIFLTALMLLAFVPVLAEGEELPPEQPISTESPTGDAPAGDTPVVEPSPAADPPAPGEVQYAEAIAEGVFQFGAISGPQMAADTGISFFAETEKTTEEKICDAIAATMERADTVVDISEFNLDYHKSASQETIQRCVSAAMNSHAKAFIYAYSYGYQPKQLGNSDTVIWESIILQYREREADARQESAEYDAARARVLDEALPGDITNMSQVEIALALHDYLVLHTRYHFDGLDLANEKGNDAATKIYPNMFNAYGALVEGHAVCQGYMEAYGDLLKQVGVSSYAISSNFLGHIWNLVQTDEGWYHIDATWDDPGFATDYNGDKDRMGYCGHDNFMLTNSEIRTQRFGGADGDMVTNIMGEEASPVSATTAISSASFWSNIDSGMFYYANHWYYRSDRQLVKAEFNKASEKTVVAANNIGYIARNGDCLYYYKNGYISGTLVDGIVEYSLDGNTETLIEPLGSSEYVYELATGPLNLKGNADIIPTGNLVYVLNTIDTVTNTYKVVVHPFNVRGDANGDGSVNIIDIIMICKHIMGMEALSGQGLVNANVDGVPGITLADAIAACKLIAA